MDKRKITFIICVNDEAEYIECKYYLSKLHVPKGYRVDVMAIRDAQSMASGYNAGMKNTDAKYKVYLHQDVFIINEDFIEDLLRIFTSDEKIGLVGMIGNTHIGVGLNVITNWDTGKVIESFREWDDHLLLKEDIFKEVQAVDGILLATQYDITWRDDIFDGWHFYDISQCMEFRKAGYKVIVPYQEKAWCYHDGEYSQKGMKAYCDHYERFVSEYAKMLGTDKEMIDPSECALRRRYVQQMEELELATEELFAVCDKERLVLREVFQNNALHGYTCLREYETIARIDQMEEEHQSKQRFWEDKMSVSELIEKFRILKRSLKRIEYGGDRLETEWIRASYSRYAIREVCEQYFVDKDIMLKILSI